MSMFFWILGIISLIVVVVVKYFQARAQYWPKRGFTVLGSEATGNMLKNIIRKTRQSEIDERIYKKAKELNKPYVEHQSIGGARLYYSVVEARL